MKRKNSTLVLQSMTADETDLHALNRSGVENEDVFFRLVLTVGMDGERGGNYFYTTLATPESLRKHCHGYMLAANRTLVVSHFDLPLLTAHVQDIVRSCSRDSWAESCEALTRYFDWEFEDYRN